MNALKHGRYAKPACVLRGENKDTFHAPIQSLIGRFQPVDEAELDRLAYSLQLLVDRSKLPQFLAARESQLTFRRQVVLNPLNPKRLTPKSRPHTNPKRTRYRLILWNRLGPSNPAKTRRSPGRRPLDL
jgi:hypothetical protein